MTPAPNSEDHLVSILRQPPITSSRQVSRESNLSDIPTKNFEKDLSSPTTTQASVITPLDNNTQAYSVISSSNDTLSSLASSSTKMPILAASTDDAVVRKAATIPQLTSPKSTTAVPNAVAALHYTISPSHEQSNNNNNNNNNKRKIPEPEPSPMSRRDSLPLRLRNKKMKATDCLLFAATLLEQETSSMVNPPPPAQPAKTPPVPKPSLPVKKSKKPLKKMFCEKVEMQEQAKQKREQQEALLEQKQQLQEEEEAEDENDSENKPKDADVLCGRGGKVNKHPGNIVYRKVVEYNKSYYQSVHKKHRILVSQSIVRAILNYGGRFMGQKGKEWTPICFKRAVQKTSQALRERSNTSDDFKQQLVVVEAPVSKD